MLKKKFLAIVLFLFLTFEMCHAQAAILVLLFGDKVATENFYFSLKLGANYANITGIEDTDPILGFNFGLLATIKLNDRFCIVPEFSALSYKGAKNIPVQSTGNFELDDLLANTSKSVRELNYIDVPIIAKYYVNETVNVGIGPTISFLTSAVDRYETTVFTDEDLVFESNIKESANMIDYGIAFEVGYTLWKARTGNGINLHARYMMGLNDILKENANGSQQNSVIQVSASFPFIQ
ncbi:PorT family protein [candidate division KSB1 bacterium]|nr:PorT family protein [candidate division KSB1 bacterium]